MSARIVYAVALLLTLTAAFACWCRLPLIWDGAYQFNTTLIMQHPYSYLTRFHTYFLWWPTVWASRLTDNMTLLQSIYGLPFLLAPVVGLLLSWWMVHRHAPHLIIWAIFGIAVGTLPGQVFVINDSIFQQHLFWPILMALFVPLTLPKRLVLTLLAVFQFVHPLGIALFLVATAAALLVAIADVENRKWMLVRAGVMLALCLLAVTKIYITTRFPAYYDSFAEQEAKWSTALGSLRAGVRGWPLRGMGYMWAAAIMLLFYNRSRLEMMSLSRALSRGVALLSVGFIKPRSQNSLGVSYAHQPSHEFTLSSARWVSFLLVLALGVLTWVYRSDLHGLVFPFGACVLLYLYVMLLADYRQTAALVVSLILAVIASYFMTQFLKSPADHVSLRIARITCAGWVISLLFIRNLSTLRFPAGATLLLCAAAGAACWIYWASDGRLWWKAIDYRRWVGPLVTPFFILAAVEGALAALSREDADEGEPSFKPWPLRNIVALLLGATYALVLGIQSHVWHRETRDLMTLVANHQGVIVPESDVPNMAQSPLDHWATADFVMGMQGKRPAKLLLDPRGEERIDEQPPRIPHWDFYPFARLNSPNPAPGPAGWFDLRPLLQQLASTPRPTPSHGTERIDIRTTPD